MGFQDIFLGKRAQVRAITLTHGPVRLALEDSLELGEKLSTKILNEFDNKYPGFIYSVFEGITGKMAFIDPNDAKALALQMDTDPAATTTFYDPAKKKQFHLAGNFRGETDDVPRGCFVISNCVPGASPLSLAVVDAAKSDIPFDALKMQRVKGGSSQAVALLYSRFKAYGSTAYAWTGIDGLGPDPGQGDLDVVANVAVPLAKAALVVPDGTARNYLLCLKNGVEVTTGFTVSSTQFTALTTVATTDVYELFTLYDPTI